MSTDLNAGTSLPSFFPHIFHTWSLLPINRQCGCTAPLNTTFPDRSKAVMLSTDNGRKHVYYLQNTECHGPVGPRCDTRACRPVIVKAVCRSCPHFLQTVPQIVTTASFQILSILFTNHPGSGHYCGSE